MTFQAWQILHILRKLSPKTNKRIAIDLEEKCFFVTQDGEVISISYEKHAPELYSVLDYLVHEGYLLRVQKNPPQFCLTQKGLHPAQLRIKALIAYMTDKWVDLAALGISIAALIVSIISLQHSL